MTIFSNQVPTEHGQEKNFQYGLKLLADDYRSRVDVFREGESHYIKNILFTAELIQDTAVHVSEETAQNALMQALSGAHITRGMAINAYAEVAAYLEEFLEYIKQPSVQKAIRANKAASDFVEKLMDFTQKETDCGKDG